MNTMNQNTKKLFVLIKGERMQDIKKEFREFLKNSKENTQITQSTQNISSLREEEKGLYIAVKYNQSANADLMDFIKKYNIFQMWRPRETSFSSSHIYGY